MTEPTRTSTGIAYLTYDATLNTDASMIIQQKLDLSGNTTAQTFCENAFDLAAGEDISGALLTDSDITDYNSNYLVYLASNDVNVQKTFLNNKLNSSIAQNIACNAYEMTLGKNNQIPLVSNLKVLQIIGYNESLLIPTLSTASGDRIFRCVINSLGNIYYNKNLGQIRKFDTNGNDTLILSGSQFDLEIDSFDNIYFLMSGKIYKLDTKNNDTYTELITNVAGGNIYGMTLDETNNYLYVAGTNKKITKINLSSPDYTSTIVADDFTFGDIYDLELDSLGNLYVADRDNFIIRKVNASDEVVTTIAGGGSSYPSIGADATSIRIKPPGVEFGNDKLYFVDYVNDTICEMDLTTGKITNILKSQLGNYVYGIHFDSNTNNIYACVTHTGVYKFTPIYG